MVKIILLIAFIFLLLVPTTTFGRSNDYSTMRGYWPTSAGECESFSQRGQCSYLLCLCYAGCNSEIGGVDLQRKGLCDGQYHRCVEETPQTYY